MNKATIGAICLIAGLFIGFFFQYKWDSSQDSKPGMISSKAKAIEPLKVINTAEEATINVTLGSSL